MNGYSTAFFVLTLVLELKTVKVDSFIIIIYFKVSRLHYMGCRVNVTISVQSDQLSVDGRCYETSGF